MPNVPLIYKKARACTAACARVAALGAAALLLSACQTATLSGEEIRVLLAGNSASYEDGARQYFGADGQTVYQTPGRRSENGTWRVSDNQYCSRWQSITGRPGPEVCYTVEQRYEVVTWNREYPATIQAGNVFDP